MGASREFIPECEGYTLSLVLMELNDRHSDDSEAILVSNGVVF